MLGRLESIYILALFFGLGEIFFFMLFYTIILLSSTFLLAEVYTHSTKGKFIVKKDLLFFVGKEKTINWNSYELMTCPV